MPGRISGAYPHSNSHFSQERPSLQVGGIPPLSVCFLPPFASVTGKRLVLADQEEMCFDYRDLALLYLQTARSVGR